MSYNFSFADNISYGAQDVNKITSRLVTSGVEDSFEDGVAYNLSGLNEAGTLVYTSGVVSETILTLKVTAGNTQNTILINPGTAFFNDGSVIEIEAGGHELSYTPGVKNYVYLKNDLISTNTSYPVCSEDAPTGDFVYLAEISENGKISDKRTYAKGKLPGYQSNDNYRMVIKDYVYLEGKSTVSKTYDIGNNNFKFLMVRNEGVLNSYETVNYGLGLYDFETGKYISLANMRWGEAYVKTNGLWIRKNSSHYDAPKNWVDVTISFENGQLTLNFFNGYEEIDSVPFELYLF